MRRFEDTLFAFAEACDVSSVRHMLIGGIAVLAWGQPRTTADVDAIITIDHFSQLYRQMTAFRRELRARGLTVSDTDLEEARMDGSHVTIFDEASGFHVDLRWARDDGERAEIAEAATIDMDGRKIRVVRPEETIAFKLKYGSAIDVQDARSILVRQSGRLDNDRLDHFARQLGVEQALLALRRELVEP